MQKHEKDNKENLLTKIHTLYSSHKMETILLIGILYFIGAAFLRFYWTTEDNPPVLPATSQADANMTAGPLSKTVGVLQAQLTLLSDRLVHQETAASPQSSETLMTLALVRGVLEGSLPLGALKTFLQREPSTPWKHSLFTTLSPVDEICSETMLEETLVLPPPPAPSSFWKRLGQKIKSLIRIQKRDQEAKDAPGKAKKIKRLLEKGALQEGLDLFMTLPQKDQTALAPWQKHLQDRLLLEKIEKEILLRLAEGESR